MDYVEKIIGTTGWHKKWESFGWEVDDVDGHNVKDIKKILLKKTLSGKPRLIIAHTVKGKGVSIMENNPNWHFKLPGRKEMEIFKKELVIDSTELE